MKTIDVNACAYCGRPSQGHFAIHRDGMGNGPELPLCNDCGGYPVPTLQDIWARIAMTDDDGNEWGPPVDICEEVAHAN